MKMPVLDRLWRNSHSIPDAGCWLWVGYVLKTGHGRLGSADVERLVHRASYVEHVGPIPAGLCVLHKCDTPACWNPAHLFLGTQLDNIRDRVAKGRSAKGDKHARLKGVDNGSSKLDESAVRSIRFLYSSGHSQRAIANRYSIGQMTVSCIVRRKTWGHVV